MHSLEPNLAMPHPLKPALLLLLGGALGRGLPSLGAAGVVEARLTKGAAGEGCGLLAEQGSRGAEDGVCRGGHLRLIAFGQLVVDWGGSGLMRDVQVLEGRWSR